jgi:hypothetical protein
MNNEERSIQSLGGIARAKRLRPKKRSDIARKAAKARWRNMTDEECSESGRKRVAARWGKQVQK